MTESRYQTVMDDVTAKLTPEEIRQGWHFCWDFDGLLVGPGMGELWACKCLDNEKLLTLRKELPEMELVEDTFDLPATIAALDACPETLPESLLRGRERQL